MKYNIVVLMLLLFGVTGSAQKVYSLQECIRIGLERNYSIRIVRNEEMQSKNNVTLGNAGYLPTVDLEGGFSGDINNERNRLASDGSIEKGNGITSEMANVGLNVNWTIFDGFGIQANYERLKELHLLGALNTRIVIEDFIAELSSEYYNLIRQKIRLNNLRSTLELSRERVRIAETHFNVGSGSGLDWQQAQVDFNADSSLVLNQLEVVYASRIRLNQLMALNDVEEQIQFKDTLIVPNPYLDEVELWESTLQTNTSLLIAEKNRHLSELDYKSIKSRDYPYLRLNAGYGYTTNWNEVGTYDLQKRLGFNYGLTVGINLFDGLNRKREKRNAKIDIENQKLRVQELKLSLRADMCNFWMAYQNNLNRWELEKENSVVAEENFQRAIDRYRLRELSGIELREAQLSLLEAEERRSDVEHSIKVCEISLLQLSGLLIEYLSEDKAAKE